MKQLCWKFRNYFLSRKVLQEKLSFYYGSSIFYKRKVALYNMQLGFDDKNLIWQQVISIISIQLGIRKISQNSLNKVNLKYWFRESLTHWRFTHSFASRPLNYRLQQYVLKYNDFCRSWSYPKNWPKDEFIKLRKSKYWECQFFSIATFQLIFHIPLFKTTFSKPYGIGQYITLPKIRLHFIIKMILFVMK